MSRSIALFGFVTLLLTGCSSPETVKEHSNVIVESVNDLHLEFAKGFEVTQVGAQRMLNIYEKDILLATYFLVDRGTEASVDSSLVLFIPLQTIVSTSTTHIPYLDKLGVLSSVIGVTGSKWIQNPTMAEQIENGTTQDIGNGAEIDLEKLIYLNPDATMVYPFQGSSHDYITAVDQTVLYNTEYLEKHPLGQAEWIKFFGVLYDKEAEADSIFKDIVDQYASLKATVKAAEKPLVLSGSIHNGTWNSPGGRSYAARFIADAGGQYIWASDTTAGSVQRDMEVVLYDMDKPDFLVIATHEDPDFTMGKLTAQDDRYALLRPVREGNALHCNAATTSYFEDALLEPHKILADLAAFFHPELIPQHQPTYFKPIILAE